MNVGVVQAGDHRSFVKINQFGTVSPVSHYITLSANGQKLPVTDSERFDDRTVVFLGCDPTVVENQICLIVGHSCLL